MKQIFVSLLILFHAHLAFAYITVDISNGCDEFYNHMHPVFEINEYTCTSGYYLPANGIECVACPPGYTCNGGTYEFNVTYDKGIEPTLNTFVPANGIVGCDNFYDGMYPVFEPNQYNCNPGYYVPANNDGCVICPANSYCPGGTYTFNENTPQGITACPSGTYSPTGMWESTQCGHILHVGDATIYMCATKKTTPALHIKIGNDTFYGNMTTADVAMNSGTTRKLKIQYNNVTYYVYDDTIVFE